MTDLNTESVSCEATDGSPNPLAWLERAEAELAVERAESDRIDEEIAVEFARIINARLAELGITPVAPARSNGNGTLVPALLVPANADAQFHSVHASFDEEESVVTLLTGDYRRGRTGGYDGLQLAVEHLVDVRNVLYARRHGPKTARPPQPSVDAQVIVGALDALRAAVDEVAHFLRP
ncbi:hypothetical protein ACFVY4_27045 [Streptomyces sp. NPDC058299]|uniref:hypothetical protein n=1 Tax=Streptomyces sp. NPDC058299 TaxID=3346435 RepID=UPI0036E94247